MIPYTFKYLNLKILYMLVQNLPPICLLLTIASYLLELNTKRLIKFLSNYTLLKINHFCTFIFIETKCAN